MRSIMWDFRAPRRQRFRRTFSHEEPYIHHFPDGNASVARLLVRDMIPQVAPGSTMEDVVKARFDYTRLDDPEAKIRLRLNSTAIRVENDGPPKTAKRVSVTYVRGGQAYRVWGRSCVLAGYNAMIPALCPEFPKAQREALALAVKVPILYTNVLLRELEGLEEARARCGNCAGQLPRRFNPRFSHELRGLRVLSRPR